MASEADFTYGPPLQGDNIRLMAISLGAGNPTLEISLVECRLGSAKFEALSYVWGKPVTRQRIKCNGRSMYVGSSLLDALGELARRRSTGLVWADAVCINQIDEQEKTRQVRMMRDIYEKAQRVIIWLGQERAGDDSGFKLANSLYQKCNGSRYNMYQTTYDFEDFDCGSKGVPTPGGNPDWTALFAILSHPWFSRIWIVQELLVAQRSIMWRGALDLNTDVIIWVTMQIARHKNLYESFDILMGSPPTSALIARNIATGYLEYKRYGPLSIYDTLSRYNGMEATDPRDRYFALAGISRLDKAFINYERSFRDVACLVGKMALLGFPRYQVGRGGVEELVFTNQPEEAHRFLIEWLAFHANPQNNNLGLPSWIPDFISPHSPGLIMSGFYNTVHLQGLKEIPSPELRLSHAGHWEWFGPPPPGWATWTIPVPDEIEIMGAVFDRVDKLASRRPPFPRPNLGEQRPIEGHVSIDALEAMEFVSGYETEMVYWLSEIRILADPTLRATDNITSGSEASFDAFWRTLIYNREPQFNYDSPNQKSASWLGVSFGYWYLWKKLLMKRLWRRNILQGVIYSQILETLARPFANAEGRVRDGRRFFVSGNCRFGWAPLRTEVNDMVCVFRGMRIPVVMRPRGDRWEFIGACYIHGWMDGEIWDLDDLQWRFMSFV